MSRINGTCGFDRNPLVRFRRSGSALIRTYTENGPSKEPLRQSDADVSRAMNHKMKEGLPEYTDRRADYVVTFLLISTLETIRYANTSEIQPQRQLDLPGLRRKAG
jgi:hypothetical protein